MNSLILAIHFIVSIFMIIIILLQAGKGADMGAAFGGGSQTVFGPRGAATFLSKLTTGAAVIFLVTSIYLANVSKNQTSSTILEGVKLPAPESQKSESLPQADTGAAAALKNESQPAELQKALTEKKASPKKQKK